MSHTTLRARTPGIVNQKGFTLIELSIVLAIIALLIGGIFVGQSLMRTAELQSIVSDIKRFQNAIALFKEKYKYLPGDMPTATSFWGTDTNCPNTPANTTPKTATCNGDGNGGIGGLNCASGTCSWTNEYETFRTWQHLADGGFIEGSYTGVTGPATTNAAMPGVNSPQSVSSGGGYMITLLNDPGGVADYPIAMSHVIFLGAFSGGSSAPLLTSTEALAIDQKMDDGLPGTGNVLGPILTPNCTTSSVAATAAYNTNAGGATCMLEFLTGFTGYFTSASGGSGGSGGSGSCAGGKTTDKSCGPPIP